MDDSGLQLTDSAISQLNALIASKDTPDLRFRVYVQGGGCSGFQYGFQFEGPTAGDDMEFDRGGVKLVVDPLSLQYLIAVISIPLYVIPMETRYFSMGKSNMISAT